MFEILDFLLMLLGSIQRIEGAKVPSSIGAGIFFSGINAVFARF